MTIPDFTEAEQKRVSELLFKRYAKLIPLQLADSELQLDGISRKLTLCPTLYWSERGAHFVVFKVGEGRYRCQFFYSEAEQFGTGREEYDDLGNCVMTLLQVQSDHERQLGPCLCGCDQGRYRQRLPRAAGGLNARGSGRLCPPDQGQSPTCDGSNRQLRRGAGRNWPR